MVCKVIFDQCYLYYFLSKGIVDVLCEACEQLKWKSPSKIQKEAIPVALQGIVSYFKYLVFAAVYFAFISVLTHHTVIITDVWELVITFTYPLHCYK